MAPKTPPAPINAIVSFPFIPDTKTIINATNIIIAAILKLFSIKTNIENTPAAPKYINGTIQFFFTCPYFSIIIAKKNTIIYFASSDGWKDIPTILSQRVAPLIFSPNNNTATNATIVIPYPSTVNFFHT